MAFEQLASKSNVLEALAIVRKQGLLGLVVAAFWFTGCGSGDVNVSSFSSSGNPASGDVRVSGRVVSEGGSGLPGVRLIANERTSDAKVETVSGPDGSFDVSLPAGVYDIGMDRTGDSQTATCFYGPIPLVSDLRRDLVLRSSNGKAAGTVFGKLLLQPGVPAANRRFNLRSGHLSGANTPQSQSFSTAADGSFEQVLSSEEELGLDIEVFDGQGVFDEFIDIGKLKKPAYVEFATELPLAANRLRSDESDPPLPTPVSSKAGDFTPFNSLQSVPDPTNGPNLLVFRDGLLPVDGVERHFFDGANDQQTGVATGLMTQAVALQFNAYRGYAVSGLIKIAKNGSWWWTYGINVNPDSSSYFEFEDQTTDVYKLHVFVSGLYWHKVSYNSSQPDIQGMATVDPLSNLSSPNQ